MRRSRGFGPHPRATFDVGAGGTHDVTVAEVWLAAATAELYLGGTHIAVSNAIGPVAVRPSAVLLVTTDNGVYEVPLHGTNTTL